MTNSRRTPHAARLTLITLFALPLLWPLLRDQTLCTHDGSLHFYRLVALRHAIEQGLIFSRWTPGLVYGYGFPFFNFREIASYYLPELLYLLGLSIPVALHLVYAGCLLLSGWGTYLLAHDIWRHEQAALVAAVAYLAAPYLMLDVYVRGNLPESMALALLPLILWLFRRLVRTPGRLVFAAAALSVAALFLTHNISSLLFIPLLVAYLAFLFLIRSRQRLSSAHWPLIAAALLIGIALTTFAWLPAIAEKGSVQLYLTHSTRGNDFHYNFLSLAELLAPLTPADPTLLNPPMQVKVGRPQLILGAIGLLGLLRFRPGRWQESPRERPQPPREMAESSREHPQPSRETAGTIQGDGRTVQGDGRTIQGVPAAAQGDDGITEATVQERLPACWVVSFRDTERRWHLAFLALATAALLLLSLPISTPLWETLPLIRFVQFPWRLVGRAALPLALLVGASSTLIPRHPSLSLLSISILILAALPWLYPGVCPSPTSPTIANVMNFERKSGLVGVDPLGAYLPRWVIQRPAGSPVEMQAALRAGTTPRRFDASTLPPGATLLRESYGPNRATVQLETPAAFQAVYHTFYFPGWTVRIDGEKVPIEPTPQTGLISFRVPPGRHTLTIRWRLTPLRAGATAVSLVALAALAGIEIWGIGGWGRLYSPPACGGSWRGARGVPLALLVFKLLLVDPGYTPLRHGRLEAGTLPGLQNPTSIRLADGLELPGYQITPAPAGSELQLDLAWTAYQPPAGNYRSRVALVAGDDNKLIWSAKETFRPPGYQQHPPTAQWRPGAWVWDSHSIPILPGTPPGNYQLQLTVFDRATLAPLNVLDNAGRVAGPNVIIGQLHIERPTLALTNLKMQHTIGRQWGNLTLLGTNLDRQEAAPGDPTLITLFWRRAPHERPPAGDPTAQLELLDPAGATVHRWALPLIRENYPPTAWRVHDALMGQHLLQIPGRTENGRHTWQLALLDAAGTPIGAPITLGQVSINAPQRMWQPPPTNYPADIEYTLESGAPFARLVGYNLEQSGERLELTLMWQAQAQTESSYRVFVHLLYSDGGAAAQSDGIPAGWTRPTSGWSPGEFITDPHTLTLPAELPAGEYPLAVGLYQLSTGNRLHASQGTLTTLTLAQR